MSRQSQGYLAILYWLNFGRREFRGPSQFRYLRLRGIAGGPKSFVGRLKISMVMIQPRDIRLRHL